MAFPKERPIRITGMDGRKRKMLKKALTRYGIYEAEDASEEIEVTESGYIYYGKLYTKIAEIIDTLA